MLVEAVRALSEYPHSPESVINPSRAELGTVQGLLDYIKDMVYSVTGDIYSARRLDATLSTLQQCEWDAMKLNTECNTLMSEGDKTAHNIQQIEAQYVAEALHALTNLIKPVQGADVLSGWSATRQSLVAGVTKAWCAKQKHKQAEEAEEAERMITCISDADSRSSLHSSSREHAPSTIRYRMSCEVLHPLVMIREYGPRSQLKTSVHGNACGERGPNGICHPVASGSANNDRCYSD